MTAKKTPAKTTTKPLGAEPVGLLSDKKVICALPSMAEFEKEQARKKSGRPRKFETVEELQTAIDAYFESCFEEFTVALKDEEGKKTGERLIKKQVEPFTITGLAIALDTTRQGLLNYEGREEFYDTIKKAKVRCENYAEKSLFGNNATGPIFNLINNYGWKNTQHIGGDPENPLFQITQLTDEQVLAQIATLEAKRLLK
jgi:hypothetical protein